MPEKIVISKDSGEQINSNIVSSFLIPEIDKKYMITTENAVDPHGLTVLHVSEIVDGTLNKISTDDEWSKIKNIMRSIISGNVASYQYLPLINSIKANGTYSRDISVSTSAAQQMSTSYADSVNSTNTEEGSGAQSVQSNPIFPTENVVPTETNEVVPGIAEIPVEAKDEQPIQVSQDVNSQAAGVIENVEVKNEEPKSTEEATQAPALETNTVVNVNNPVEFPNSNKVTLSEEPVTTENKSASDNNSSSTTPGPVIDVSKTNTDVPSVTNVTDNNADDDILKPIIEMVANDVAKVETDVDSEPIKPEISSQVSEPSAADNSTFDLVPPDIKIPAFTNFSEKKDDNIEKESQPVVTITEMPTEPISETQDVQNYAMPVNELPQDNGIETANVIQNMEPSTYAIPEQNTVGLTNLNQSIVQLQPLQQVAPNYSLQNSYLANPPRINEGLMVQMQGELMSSINAIVGAMAERLSAELVNRELELQNREALIAQKERIFNDQMNIMMSNFSALQQAGATPSMVNGMGTNMGMISNAIPSVVVTPNLVQPTVVQAANDINS